MAQDSEDKETPKDLKLAENPKGIPKNLEAALTLLEKHDDTSHFVGLALLKPCLEHELSSDNTTKEGTRYALIQRCWDAIPGKFLARLLKARTNGQRTKEEANSMVELAVAVTHAFMELLESPHVDEKFMSQVPLLLATLRSCPQQTRTLIMGIFHTLAMTPEGSKAIFKFRAKDSDVDQKPESYLFITMLLIDIRSTIPSLEEKLHANDYLTTSERLGRAYDIISAFIGFLIQSLEMMSSGDGSANPLPSAPLPVDLLLKLRTNISETMSLTIEHLRDRYDSSTAGAAGLRHSARSSIDPSSPLPIAWDTSSGIFEDPFTLSQLRTLSLWLRDEENDALRREAAGIMDVLLALYSHVGEQDFRFPVLVALEGIIECADGVEAFLQEEGWATLSKDLTKILQQPSSDPAFGIEIVRTLLVVVETDFLGKPRDEWFSIVTQAEDLLNAATPTLTLELPIAVAQLAVELLTRSSRGLRMEYHSQARKLLEKAENLLVRGTSREDDREGLVEVVSGLSCLGLR